jgi:hypothetical protein
MITGAGLSKYRYDRNENVESAPTRAVAYDCESGHSTVLRFDVEVEEIPVTWDCPRCSAVARTVAEDAVEFPVKKPLGGPPKTPWQHLRERRSIEELEELLAERLEILRSRFSWSESA